MTVMIDAEYVLKIIGDQLYGEMSAGDEYLYDHKTYDDGLEWCFELIRNVANNTQETILVKPPKWISVKDRLPEELTPVNVVWVNHNPQLYYSKIKDVPQSNATAVYFCGRWYWWDAVLIDWLGEYGRCGREESLVDKEIEITHWMPLPEPPEVEDANDE